MAQKPKSKFFRVAVEGATTDGRSISRADLEQMARNYDPKKYTARIFIEHIRGLHPEWGFRCMGDVVALRTGQIELDGRTLLTLEAQIEPTDELIALTRAKQKIYSSIEIAPNFAGSNEAYLFGLGVTDSPASLGTEVLQFAAQNPAASPFVHRKGGPDHLFSAALPVDIDWEESSPSLLERVTALFRTERASDEARLADVHAAIEQVAQGAAAAQVTASHAGEEAARLRQALDAFAARLEHLETAWQTSPSAPSVRPVATGAAPAPLTDC